MLAPAAAAAALAAFVVCSPNYSSPWQMLQQTKCTATGFVISPLGSRRILTNAHAVANQIAVKIRKHGCAQKFNARVLAVGHEVRLSLFGVWVFGVLGEGEGGPAQGCCWFSFAMDCRHNAHGWGTRLHNSHHAPSLTPSSLLNMWLASLSLCVQCDIAMLTVDDDEFWADMQPLDINGLPAMQESVMVVGFPTG